MVRISNGTGRVGGNFPPSTTSFLTARPDRYDPTWTRTTLACRFDGTPADASGNGLSLTANNVSYVSGKNGQAAQFNGSSSRLAVNTPGSAAKFYGDFTVEMWVKPTSLPAAGRRGVFISTSDSYTPLGIEIMLYNSGSSQFIDISTNSVDIFMVAYTTSTTQFTHLALVRSGSRLLLFVGGVLLGSASWTGVFSATNISIGAEYDGTLPYNGLIDDLQITHAAKYTANFTPESSSFIAQSA